MRRRSYHKAEAYKAGDELTVIEVDKQYKLKDKMVVQNLRDGKGRNNTVCRMISYQKIYSMRYNTCFTN